MVCDFTFSEIGFCCFLMVSAPVDPCTVNSTVSSRPATRDTVRWIVPESRFSSISAAKGLGVEIMRVSFSRLLGIVGFNHVS